MPGIISSNSCFGQVERSSKRCHSNYSSSTSQQHKIFLLTRSLFSPSLSLLIEGGREVGEVLYAQCFHEGTALPHSFCPKATRGSEHKKEVNSRLRSAAEDIPRGHTSKGQCQGASSVASAETLGGSYTALLRGETLQVLPRASEKHVHSTRDRKSEKAMLLTCELSSIKMFTNKLCR